MTIDRALELLHATGSPSGHTLRRQRLLAAREPIHDDLRQAPAAAEQHARAARQANETETIWPRRSLRWGRCRPRWRG